MALLMAGIMVLAVNLRASITSLPPVFPELASALHLSTATVSVLAAAPVVCFGLFSGLGAPLSRRFGEERVLLAALLLVAGGLLLRAAVPAAMLFPGTVLAGGAIALMNVLLPSLIKRRHPERAGLLIGAYLLTLGAGSVVASLIAVPVFKAAGNGPGWPVALTLGWWRPWCGCRRSATAPGRPGPGAWPGRPCTGTCWPGRSPRSWDCRA